jgi:hypothetical protein
MDQYSSSEERGATDFVLFALGFAGFLLGTGGVIVSSPCLAFTGTLLLLIAVAAV